MGNKAFKIIVICFFLFIQANSQEVVLEENVSIDSINENFGPNYKNFRHFYASSGFIVGENNAGSKLISGLSREINFGYRIKRKINKFYAVGVDAEIINSFYYLNQTKEKIFPNDSLHNSEKLVVNKLGFDVYNRINIGKRGNYIGNFIDLGAFINYHYKSKLVVKDQLRNSNDFYAKKTKSVYSKLNFLKPVQYGLIVRVGINRYVIYAKYNKSELFDSKYNFPEFPAYIVGVQIGLHK